MPPAVPALTPQAPIPAGDPDIIDLTILARLLDFNEDKVRTLAVKFLHATEAGLAEMEAALEGGDVQRVRELGHRTKSAARIVGALGMATLCEQLENLPLSTPHADSAAAAAIMARLLPLFGQVTERIVLLAAPTRDA